MQNPYVSLFGLNFQSIYYLHNSVFSGTIMSLKGVMLCRKDAYTIYMCIFLFLLLQTIIGATDQHPPARMCAKSSTAWKVRLINTRGEFKWKFHWLQLCQLLPYSSS